MSKDRKRSVSTAQLKMRLIQIYFDGADADPSPDGFDEFLISDITKLQTGQYTVILKAPFERSCRALAQSFGDINRYCVIEAVAYDRVTFSIRRRDTQARVDDIADLWIYGSDSRYNVA